MSTNDQNNGNTTDPNANSGAGAGDTNANANANANAGADNNANANAGGDNGGNAKETPQEKIARLTGQLKRAAKDAGVDLKSIFGEENAPVDNKKSSKKTEELGYGEKAFLIANGIKEADEIALVEKAMKDSGKSLEEIVGASWFQAELKDARDAKAATAALPGKGNRTGQSASDSVEYWIAKGELPPNTPENRDLRQKVVNARIKNESDKKQFTDRPVAGNGAR